MEIAWETFGGPHRQEGLYKSMGCASYGAASPGSRGLSSGMWAVPRDVLLIGLAPTSSTAVGPVASSVVWFTVPELLETSFRRSNCLAVLLPRIVIMSSK